MVAAPWLVRPSVHKTAPPNIRARVRTTVRYSSGRGSAKNRSPHSTTPKASAAAIRQTQTSPHPVAVMVFHRGSGNAPHDETSWVMTVSTSNCPTDAPRKTARASHVRPRERYDSLRPTSIITGVDRSPNSTGRVTSSSNTRPPDIASAPSRVSQRSTGATGDCSSGWSICSTGAPERGCPTANTKEPRTRCPSTVDTFFQATV